MARGDALAAYAAQARGAETPWLADYRRAAAERFAACGFPDRRVEAWKYTDLRPLLRQPFTPAPPAAVDAAEVARHLAGLPAGPRLVFVNGRVAPALSSSKDDLPAGVRLASLAEAAERLRPRIEALDEAGDGPMLLNAALMTDGAAVEISGPVEAPLHLLFLATGEGTASHLRNLVIAEPGAVATIIESWAGSGAYWSNAVTGVQVERGAALTHLKLTRESSAAVHLANVSARIEASGVYRSFALATGGRLARTAIAAELAGEGAECRLDGLYLAGARQHLDTTTVIDHAAPGCTSAEHYRGVIDDGGRGVFQGRIVVRPGAQKTDARQLNKVLLLGETAHADSKPELVIDADDVTCSHGAAIGEIDHDALFYLRARGLDPTTAERLLVEAFADEVVATLSPPSLIAALRPLVAQWLQSR